MQWVLPENFYLLLEKITCHYHVQLNLLYLLLSPLLLFLLASVKACSPSKMGPVSLDHLAASYRSVVTGVIGPRQEGSLSQKVT